MSTGTGGRRWWLASQVISWLHCLVALVTLVGVVVILVGPRKVGLVVGAGVVLTVLTAAITVLLVVASLKIRHKDRVGLVILVSYGLLGAALASQLVAGSVMSAGSDSPAGYVGLPIGAAVVFLATAVVPIVTFVISNYPAAGGRSGQPADG
ncbi:MAG: hypothetical protein ACR2I1_05390 [Propionibacteriaceae bacterium]